MKKITLLTIVFMTMVTFHTQAQGTEIVLTQSTDNVFITGAMSCVGGDNSWYRDYVLSEEGVSTDIKIVGVQFGLELISFNEELEIYAYNFTNFPTGFNPANSPTPIASGRVNVGISDLGRTIRVDFDTPALVSVGSSIVVRIVQPNPSGNLILLAVTEQETKTSFLSSKKCNINDKPLTVSSVGFPKARHMINLIVVDETLSLTKNLIENVAIFPNPTNGNLNLKVPSQIEVLNVTMFDVLGKNVGVLYHNQILNTSNLPKGVYILKVETSQGSLTRKIVKQ